AALDARANQLARHLRALGVGPEVPVALCLERSSERVVAILGVLKAGGMYVPLDPTYPAERLRFLLHDSAPAVVITNGGASGAAGGVATSAWPEACAAFWAASARRQVTFVALRTRFWGWAGPAGLAGGDVPATVHQVVTGGEELPVEAARAWFEAERPWRPLL